MTSADPERMPVIRVHPGELPDDVLVVGDPDRAQLVADRLDDAVELGRYREYLTYAGRYKGQPVAVTSHGVGPGGAAICFEELCRAGAKRIVRAGTAGGLQDHVRDGSVVVATAAVREEGLTDRLVPAGYPAIASRHLTAALYQRALALDIDVHEGIVLTHVLFYPHDVLGKDTRLWQRAGVTAVEMECSALFVIAALHGIEAGAILAIDGNTDDNEDMSDYNPHRDIVKSAVEAALSVSLDVLTAEQ